jgi:hypothetical protein
VIQVPVESFTYKENASINVAVCVENYQYDLQNSRHQNKYKSKLTNI